MTNSLRIHIDVRLDSGWGVLESAARIYDSAEIVTNYNHNMSVCIPDAMIRVNGHGALDFYAANKPATHIW